MSSLTRQIGDQIEHFLSHAGFDRAPWLAVALAAGILAWFGLAHAWAWMAFIFTALLLCALSASVWRGRDNRILSRQAIISTTLVFAAGIALIWARSELVGAEPIERPKVELVQGYVLEREDQPALDRVRITLAIRDAEAGESRKIRVNVPSDLALQEVREGATVRLRVRLMPPAGPMLPGSYDFARAAWFQGLAATGSAMGEVTVVNAPDGSSGLAALQRYLSSHVRERVDGSAGAIAGAFASGDRGAISQADDDAMRDAGLTHLLSISGLHVSAVIAGAYFMFLKIFALIPPLALRVRLPVLAAAAGALAGIGYTLLTGAEVPTVRSCAAAMLVLIALALGRDALSLRMVAAAAIFVLLLWPESLIGPSFQMSFAAVIAIVALHTSSPVKAFLAPREEQWWQTAGRRVVMLFITGLVIEIALMPIVLFHFHRAGIYGAAANILAIPLVTFVSMPLIALGLLLDLAGIGAPIWWLVEKSLEFLLWIAHFTASQPGSVKLMPQMSMTTVMLFVSGALWLALWTGHARFFGLVPVSVATMMLLATPVPDILIGRDGRHVGVTVTDANGERELLSLRDSRSSYARDNLIELSSVKGEPVPMTQWPDAECSSEFCVLVIERAGRVWTLLLSRSGDYVEERALAAACERADIVVSDRFLPRSCKPRWLKADRRFLAERGGLAINLESQTITATNDSRGEHGW